MNAQIGVQSWLNNVYKNKLCKYTKRVRNDKKSMLSTYIRMRQPYLDVHYFLLFFNSKYNNKTIIIINIYISALKQLVKTFS